MRTFGSKAARTPASARASLSAPGVNIDAGFGTVYAGVNSVTTTGPFRAVSAPTARDGTIVLANDIVTFGKYSPGIVATVTGPAFASEAQPAVEVHSGTISTTGKYSRGIVATNPIGSVAITSGSIETAEEDSDGIFGRANGQLSIQSGSITTSGADATGIRARGGDRSRLNESSFARPKIPSESSSAVSIQRW